MDLSGLLEEVKNIDTRIYKIKDICEIKRGRVISKLDIADNPGDYPVYSSQTINNGELGKISHYDFDGEYVSWTTDGANAGTVFYRHGKFSVTNVCGLLKLKVDFVNTKFLYYFLSTITDNYVNKSVNNHKLMSNVMAEIEVRIPSLDIQNKIVYFLDVFTALGTENKKRLEQYKAYRNSILNTNSNLFRTMFSDSLIEMKALKEFADIKIGKQINKEQLSKEGLYPVMNGGTIPSGYYHDWNVEKDIISVAQGGNPGYVQYNYNRFWAGGHCYYLLLKSNEILNKYLYFYLKDNEEYFFKSKQGKAGTSIPSLNRSVLQEFKVPLLSIQDQEKTIEILDTLETLSIDTQIGLPAEIRLREQQYQYYLKALLSFNSK